MTQRYRIVLVAAFCFSVVVCSVLATRRRHSPCLEEDIEKREEIANLVFTGTVQRIYRANRADSRIYRSAVHVKRVLKGDRNLADNTVIVEGFGDPHICQSDVREKDTRIFLLDQQRSGRLKLNSSLVRININSLHRAVSAVHGKQHYSTDLPYKKRPPIQEKPCEKLHCSFGAQCYVDDKNSQASCRCPEACPDVFAPVCGNDNVTYSSECQLQSAACTQQKKIFVSRQGTCDMKNPCDAKLCRFGAECKPSLDGMKAECVCLERCATYGDSRGSRPVCGSDGQDYTNVCELRKITCNEMREVQVKFQGRCDPCEGVECPASQVCHLDDNRNPICRCNPVCSDEVRPVCGSDGKTYYNECTLRVEACKTRRSLRKIYVGECSAGANPCEGLRCGPGEECDIDRYGIANCRCPSACEPVMRPVCGDDGVTYDNECEPRRQGCLLKKEITLAYKGVCDEAGPCHNQSCHVGAVCVASKGKAYCECPTCSEEYQPVCGSNAISYTNYCKLRREACEKKVEIRIAFNGLCNVCENKKCEVYSICERDRNGEARCACPKACVKMDSPVCGSDGHTYPNECQLRVASCQKQQLVTVATRGPCDVCENVHCKYGARCEDGQCVCPSECPETYEPVCGNDGMTYGNECEMRRSSCQQSQDLTALFYGECEDVGGSGTESGSGISSRCDDSTCLYGGVCDQDSEGTATCGCHFECPAIKEIVCGSDGKLHDNECKLRLEACKEQKAIKPLPLNKCQDTRTVPCDGELPLVDPLSGQDYFCGESTGKPCPPSSYCHKTATFAKCCREVALIKSCVDTVHGCCPDGKTAAQGPNEAGCPSVCQCNKLGSYGQTCNPVTRQCPCKPGVGGLHCERCEAGFWGLHKISEGNIGCIPCTCNEYGSVRDDCEQMTGRCVCRHGIQGMKCDVCPPGMVLIAGGCTDESIARTVPGTCALLVCRHGATCKETNGRAQCVCDIQCPLDENHHTVCGSDGTTYGSQCQLQLFSCRYQKTITVWAQGACQKGFNSQQPTAGPVRRSTIHKVTSAPRSSNGTETKTLRNLTLGLPENLFLGYKPTVVTPTSHPVETPAFSGRSFLELPRLSAHTQLTIELELRTFSDDGILLYNGQTPFGKGDFVSLAIRDGFVEFRYNLGSGPVTLRSTQRLTPGRYHRLTAKRYLRDGILSLDDADDVSGRSQGMLTSLNLQENLFVGFVPSKSKGVFENIGIRSGFVGCIRRLRLGRREVDLRYPKSKDIIRGSDIGECSGNPCSSLPCQNGASCLASTRDDFTCLCSPKFTGVTCEVPVDPCSSSPCGVGTSCIQASSGRFQCLCADNTTRCQEARHAGDSVFIPAFNGSSFIELPSLQRVGQGLQIILWFMPRAPNGLLLYNGQMPTGKGDFISLNLVDGKIEFRYDLGSGKANISSRLPVSLGNWHSVRVNRQKRHGTLQIDKEETVHGESKAPLNELNLGQPLFVGGFRSVSQLNKEAGARQGFVGAIQRLEVNGNVLDDLMRRALSAHNIQPFEEGPCVRGNACQNRGLCLPQLGDYICRCTRHYTGRHCEHRLGEAEMEQPVKFNGKTFISFPNKITVKVPGQRENHYLIRFRTSQPHGLLLWINQPGLPQPQGDFLALALVKGRLQLSFNLGKDTKLLAAVSAQRLDDGRWHTAIVHRDRRLGTLTVDDYAPVSLTSHPGATELNTDGILWIGGSPNLPSGLSSSFYHGFTGCISTLRVDGEILPLLSSHHKLLSCS